MLEVDAPNNLLLLELFLCASTARRLCTSAPANSVPKLGVPIDLGNVCSLNHFPVQLLVWQDSFLSLVLCSDTVVEASFQPYIITTFVGSVVSKSLCFNTVHVSNNPELPEVYTNSVVCVVVISVVSCALMLVPLCVKSMLL